MNGMRKMESKQERIKRLNMMNIECEAILHEVIFTIDKMLDLNKYFRLFKGAVTLCDIINDKKHDIINDKKHNVKVHLDADFKYSFIGVHPNENTATVW